MRFSLCTTFWTEFWVQLTKTRWAGRGGGVAARDVASMFSFSSLYLMQFKLSLTEQWLNFWANVIMKPTGPRERLKTKKFSGRSSKIFLSLSFKKIFCQNQHAVAAGHNLYLTSAQRNHLHPTAHNIKPRGLIIVHITSKLALLLTFKRRTRNIYFAANWNVVDFKFNVTHSLSKSN